MKRSGSRTIVFAALMAGTIGGAASARLWPAPVPAYADQQILTTISAKQFQVMDGQGNVRAKLDVSDGGLAHLGLYDQEGVERAALVVSNDGTSMLALSGDNGNPRLAVNVATHDGPADFKLLNPDNSVAAALKMDKSGRSLTLADDNGAARIALQTTVGASPESSLTIYGKDGKPVKKFP
jgi:hypothetical protein